MDSIAYLIIAIILYAVYERFKNQGNEFMAGGFFALFCTEIVHLVASFFN